MTTKVLNVGEHTQLLTMFIPNSKGTYFARMYACIYVCAYDTLLTFELTYLLHIDCRKFLPESNKKIRDLSQYDLEVKNKKNLQEAEKAKDCLEISSSPENSTSYFSDDTDDRPLKVIKTSADNVKGIKK